MHRQRITTSRTIAPRATLAVAALLGAALGCTTFAEPEATTTVESESVITCKPGDSQHTIASAPTCTWTVDTFVNDGVVLSAGAPRTTSGTGATWLVDCYLNGIKCGGAGTKQPFACPSPEYAAAGQDIACEASWTTELPGFLGTVDTGLLGIPTQHPSATRALNECKAKYNNLTTDLNATASSWCNAYATSKTTASSRAPVCCKPAPVPPPPPPPPPGNDGGISTDGGTQPVSTDGGTQPVFTGDEPGDGSNMP